MKESLQIDLLNILREFVGYFESIFILVELCECIVLGMQKIIGYDCVMVYWFDENYNGEVIVEVRWEDLEGFFGLYYLYMDIFVQVWVLYIKNQLCVFVDIDYMLVFIFINFEVDNVLFDFSYFFLRSILLIYVQYLYNMGVGVILMILLLYCGKLWGLIVCYYYLLKFFIYE